MGLASRSAARVQRPCESPGWVNDDLITGHIIPTDGEDIVRLRCPRRGVYGLRTSGGMSCTAKWSI